MFVFRNRKIVFRLVLISLVLGFNLKNISIINAVSDDMQEWSYAPINEVIYLEDENMLRLRDATDDHNYFFIDLDGNLIENPQLRSQYLVTEINDGIAEVYNVFGTRVDNLYIEDPEQQEIIGGMSLIEGDWIWIKEIVPTLERTTVYVKAVDIDTGEEMLNLDCSRYVEVDDTISISEFIDNGEKDILFFNSFAVDLKTGQFVRKDVARNESGYESCDLQERGYSKIIDTKGNNALSFAEDPDQFDYIGKYSEDLFFNTEDYSFYDINFNKVLDLSEYPLYLYSTSSGYSEDQWYNRGFYFTGGYCWLSAKNEDEMEFFSLIDKDGNFIIDWTTEEFSYYGKVYSDLIHIYKDGINYLYDVNTEELTEVSDIFSGVQINEKLYYINQNALYSYNLLTKESNKVEIVGLTKENSGSLIGLWHIIGGEYLYYFGDDFTAASYTGTGKVSTEATYSTYVEDNRNMLVIDNSERTITYQYELNDDQLVLINEDGYSDVLERVTVDVLLDSEMSQE